ncbi:MAG TPA: hypothetical protein VG222_09840 [Vicinamibacterales bacterium]|nr:hypothetical protein [Vicinamibacterales bacterium]
MDSRFRWGAVWAAVLFAVIVGIVSFNAGVSHGLAVSAPSVGAAPGTAVPFYWYRPWGFGFGLFPFAFVLFWFLLFRVAFGGFHRRRWSYYGPHDVPSSFDEWHRRAHERMNGVPPAQSHGTT